MQQNPEIRLLPHNLLDLQQLRLQIVEDIAAVTINAENLQETLFEIQGKKGSLKMLEHIISLVKVVEQL